ncbi:MAG: bifunctional diaminohydroxyphosphoribosylaminopyrimidine deaminase/5-amino-6-(5-phosphoribosylamino)uracil reductase RibD [Proteobacteria bacterium]|nr:bifunctional diaminohydroxyphosphoribosylaminopyrimidine deaminase/5-amino-6-(5-phosphoribosylamino)uracil reductase RibD [Pseudomonadota bacterium]
MAAALRLAGDGLGRVWPNPAVGCLIIKDDKTVGRGWTQPGGRPHAEFEALQMAGAKAKGATAYVTLEPCAHQGETRSCARLLARAEVKRVIYSVSDPDPRTAGKGAEIMKKAGVQVDYGLLEEEAKALNKGYFLKQTEGRPLVAMKLATSKDGKIAKAEGVETCITGRQAREYSHRLRASHDAILVGIGTVLADDPDLTCRLPDKDVTSPVRIVLDTKLKIPLDSRLVQSAHEVPVWVVTEQTEIPPELIEKGVEIVSVNNIKNIKQVLELIAQKGITRLLVEGGSGVNASFLKSGLVDDVYWFTAPYLTIGHGGVPAIRGSDIKTPDDLTGFKKNREDKLGKDIVEILKRLD